MNCAVISVHPDDETIGCGGTLLKHKSMGDTIHWIILTGAKKEDGFSTRIIDQKKQEILKIKKAYPFDGTHQLGYPATRLDEYPIAEIVEKIGQIFSRIQPEIVYLPFKNDVHSDHRVAFQAAFSCTKVFRFPFLKRILMMEILSETEFAPPLEGNVFAPNVFVDISNHFQKKIETIRIYRSELKRHPFPRSIENIESLAKLRGASAGCRYAEAFMLLKEIL